jgi:hypothetical protein
VILILDQSQAVVRGAAVGTTNDEALANSRITADLGGSYHLPLVPPIKFHDGVQRMQKAPRVSWTWELFLN